MNYQSSRCRDVPNQDDHPAAQPLSHTSLRLPPLMTFFILTTFFTPVLAEDYLQPSLANSGFSSKTSHKFVEGLSNERLAEQAKLMRSTEMSSTHRALNHQWLAVQSGQAKQIQGSKIASKLAQKTFKTYWKNRNNEEGSISLSDEFGEIETRYNDVDYKLRLNKNTIKLKFKYDFQ